MLAGKPYYVNGLLLMKGIANVLSFKTAVKWTLIFAPPVIQAKNNVETLSVSTFTVAYKVRFDTLQKILFISSNLSLYLFFKNNNTTTIEVHYNREGAA